MSSITSLPTNAHRKEVVTSRKGELRTLEITDTHIEIALKVKNEIDVPSGIIIENHVEFEREAFKIWLRQTLAELE